MKWLKKLFERRKFSDGNYPLKDNWREGLRERNINHYWFYDKRTNGIERSNIAFGEDENTSCTYKTYMEVVRFVVKHINK